MLEIIIPAEKLWGEGNEEFINVPETKLQLEHSLISLKKWESKWHKPFLGNQEKTTEEMVDYIRCMTINKGVDPNIYICIPSDKLKEISDYIKDKHTATTITNLEESGIKKPGGRKTITAEVIYCWMILLNIPVEFQKWHLGQLLTLIKVVNLETSPKKKMSRREAAKQRAALNEARRKKYNTRG